MLESEDVSATLAAIRNFGVEVTDDGEEWLVRGGPWQSHLAIDCGNSGTTARLLMGAVAGMAGSECPV
jgi:3-phosphoshikimate 1-carboxyvinyltransferase